MNKINKLKLCAMIAFIVLMLSTVFASSEETDGSNEGGTLENPFVISITGSSGANQTFHFSSYPFYFKTNTIGSFEVNVDNTSNEVTFTLVDNNVNHIIAVIENMENVDNMQLGIDYRETSDSLISTPKYDISEMIMGTLTGRKAEVRKNKLLNIAPSANILATRSNLYFFTNFNDTKVIEQINSLKASNTRNSINDWMNYSNLGYQNSLNPTIDDMIYEFNGTNNSALADKNVNDKNSIEAIITRLFVAVGDNFLLKSLRSLFKENNISINTLIFNQFEPTKLDLYNPSATGTNQVLRDAVNKWYNIFLTFTYICYIIILVYIGVMIITVAGTPRQEKAKSFFTNWVVGLVLLILLPHYGFPLLFKLNDALVAYIGKDASNMDTYYTVLERHDEIDGGDSMTVAIQTLEEERKSAQDSLEQTQATADRILEDAINDIIEPYFENNTNQNALDYKNDLVRRLKETYSSYKYYRNQGRAADDTYELQRGISQTIIYSADLYEVGRSLGSNINSDFMKSDGPFQTLLARYEEAYQYETQIEQLDQDIVTLQNDILGLMRSYAGEYNRLIFGVLFLMLLFQLVGLLILYIKRLLMIAILIAVFPIVMLFYCIDKMADDTAQTLSLWFKELLANIYIQAVHAVIYRVLVEMGLEVFKRDSGNWILLVCAMMLLLPAESIMKSIFNLNGVSLGQVGGMLEKAAIGIGALRSLATAGKRSDDKAVTSKEKRYAKNAQRKQTRADNRQTARDYRRAANNVRPDGFVKSAKNLAYDAGDLAHKAGNAIRKKRIAIHNVKTKAGRFTRYARNAASIVVGAAYGLAGGDVNSMVAGAAIARTLSGKQGTDKEFVKKQKEAGKKETLKTRVGSAYRRKKH